MSEASAPMSGRAGAPGPAARRIDVAGNGVRLAVFEWEAAGSGPALLLLHGITGSALDWGPVVGHLDATAVSRVVAFDARGHGESDWDAGEAYSGDAHFADVLSLVDAMGLEGCVLAGFSMGGGVAMMVAAARPEQVRGLVVVDAYPSPEMTPGSLGIARALAAWSVAADGGTTPWGGRPFDPAIARSFARDLAAGEARRLDLWPFWETVACPVLLIRGELSVVLPAELAMEMIRRRPGARLETLAGVGHGIPFARPSELANRLGAFVGSLA